MGYMHITNLYKNQDILMFKQCYALEKIHGTSAHITWKNNRIIPFSGGESYKNFLKLFNFNDLEMRFLEHFENSKITLYGEAYGGKQQGMSDTYGKDLKFIVFDVNIDGVWLNVPNAHDVTTKMGLEFVDYSLIDTDIGIINAERDKPSTQAKRNGILEDKFREGIVLRPIIELHKSNGDRMICKHKQKEFCETKTYKEVSGDRLEILTKANDIAIEWVTLMRLKHVLDKLGNPNVIEKTGIVIKAMTEDILREAENEIIINKEVNTAIGRKTAKLYKNFLKLG